MPSKSVSHNNTKPTSMSATTLHALTHACTSRSGAAQPTSLRAVEDEPKAEEQEASQSRHERQTSKHASRWEKFERAVGRRNDALQINS